MIMLLSRLGSLHALDQTRRAPAWSKYLGGSVPSADTTARVLRTLELGPLRETIAQVYARLKRNKALEPPTHGLTLAVLDGHECTASYLRHCPDCMTRTTHTKDGDRTQYFHRLVSLALVTGDHVLSLDAEEQRPGEDEVATALRLLRRVVARYPRAFDVVGCDGLYAQAPFLNSVMALGKHFLVVLKNKDRVLMKDARSLFPQTTPEVYRRGSTKVEAWDIDGLRDSWPELAITPRVVRTLESRPVRRQMTKKVEEINTEWIWVTDMDRTFAPTRAIVKMGHDRWKIENEGYNELTGDWHADHVYTHAGNAIMAMWLLTFLAQTIFQIFWQRNLSPLIRRQYTKRAIAQAIKAALFATLLGACPTPHPT